MRRADLSPEVQRTLKRLPAPYSNHYGVVPDPPPSSSPSVVPVAARHEAAIKALGRLEVLVSELQDPWPVSRVLARREAVSSSAVEGTHSTLDELLAVEETEDADGDRRTAAKQVRDYAVCLDGAVPLARSRGPAVFTQELLRDLHVATMKGDADYSGVPGELRSQVVWIGGRGDIAYSTFNVTRMAVAHAHFEAVHPFADGNGRVGRLLLPLMMAAEGQVPLYLSPFIEANRTEYYTALKAAQQRVEWHEVVGFLADAITGTVDELLATRKALEDIRRIWLSRRRFRAGSAALRALDVLPHYPVATVGRLAVLLDVSWPQAARAVSQLVEVGILEERTGYRRNRLFIAREALAIINRPFGEEPILLSGSSG